MRYVGSPPLPRNPILTMWQRERRQEEFERTEKEKEAELQRKDEEVREVEVRYNLYLFRWNVVPIPSQKGKKRRQLQREKEEQEAQGLEVCCYPQLFWQNAVLTPSQEERQRKELERQNEEKEARRHKRKEKEKGPLPDDGRDDGGNDPQTPHGLGRTSPYKTTVSGGYLQGGQSQNPSRELLCPIIYV